MKPLVRAAIAIAACLPALAGTARSAVANPCGTTSVRPSAYKHVVVIVMENKSRAEGLSGRYAKALAGGCSQATNYHAQTHPSLPNYLTMVSGSDQGVHDDGLPSQHSFSGPSIFSQVDYRAIQESMHSACQKYDSYPYVVKHNPAVYFTSTVRCHGRDYGFPYSTPWNLAHAYTFITPNLCNDTHDCAIATGDKFLAGLIPKLTATPQYEEGSTVIFLTWDEDDYSASNNVGFVAIAPYARPGLKNRSYFSHCSMLRMVESNFTVVNSGRQRNVRSSVSAGVV